MRSAQVRHAAAGAGVDEGHLGAHPRGVAHERHVLRGHRREQAQELRRVQVQVVAEGTGHVDPVELVQRHAEGVEQQLPAGVDGALGELQIAHVVLREDDVAVHARGDDVLATLVALAHEGVFEETAGRVHHARAHEAGEQVDDPGAADAERRLAGDGPDVDGLAGRRDAHALDGAGHRLHAVLDLVALEGGTRGAARDGHAAVVSQRDLRVGADVDGHGRALLAHQVGGGDHGQRIRADEAGDGRREVHAGLRVDRHAELRGAQRHRLGDARRERGGAQADWAIVPAPGGASRCCPPRSCRRSGAARLPGAHRARRGSC